MSQLQRITIHTHQIQATQLLLTSQQQHYLLRVLRLRDGDQFIAMDGMGEWLLAQLQGEQGKILGSLAVKMELPVSITLMMALPKGNGFDEVVRCCTELGVTCIAPVLSDRSLLNPSSQKLERWRRIASEAAEQSERTFVPTILDPVTFNTFLNKAVATHRYICEARGNYPHLKQVINNTTNDIIIAIGPEGGWTNQEIEMAVKLEFQPISLGRRILRAVTAPIVAISLIGANFE
ncbi:16S rRNA (uracil(1498)-N(3))-methyltransferase [Aphanizomenon flos-aquae NRERC-008]|jgi:16S rRNA (uracil1498-N3)-methyltransferase|uniref:Ribosomal RNA small subunit methyltransferase E n=1 Tax=Aphanizomenon flos-aquae FACHB-1249 TaxID=2692889 RepID=A0ABR8ITJ6_APHFL|nr:MULTISPECIES: 16S rRNA (uracil(1498)-N(3))-methyltransferase [Aphanizomenon]MCE2906264.1 16S rRNA (uracil(1498)-N(3))-methyltransferase [Anabaena sp. CoA2_C59]MBD2391162.1 16S rRNA (uracil(1498)-N(3))-methyltransferase [Aphanizomenon flos-aquae FACHB-1171]MBD2556501.1 16S rRNA (uracil(1498)-N(3))-methyltransferase [Aphanizomenon flos-aquae FACHB-1290]MBD2632122.1 16S rRNA (uracil(1498)-N(3))-methyltransferase [Aphanizomenon sp. FACHB-1399]MBD2642917.1 16S rRNA (uracil(1498)-N(3))-methyltran